MKIIYKTNYLPTVEEVTELYKSSGINRPVDDKKRIYKMYAHSNLIVTAWNDDKLVGVSRALTDFCYCCYLSDLAVSMDYQKQGIGKKLIEITKETAGDQTTLILLAAPDAVDYYPKIGLERIQHGFVIRRKL